MSNGAVIVRAERRGDETAIRALNEAAFGRPDEGALVDALREAGQVTLSLVAEAAGKVAGHILFTPVEVAGDGQESWRAVALGPMAVRPEFQNRGIGSKLVRAGLEGCRELGEQVIFVLGHPAFYRRLGFTPAAAHGIQSEYTAGDAFMVVELAEGSLAGRRGTVIYHAAFNTAG
jgi:putative acetyltransferase